MGCGRESRGESSGESGRVPGIVVVSRESNGSFEAHGGQGVSPVLARQDSSIQTSNILLKSVLQRSTLGPVWPRADSGVPGFQFPDRRNITKVITAELNFGSCLASTLFGFVTTGFTSVSFCYYRLHPRGKVEDAVFLYTVASGESGRVPWGSCDINCKTFSTR